MPRDKKKAKKKRARTKAWFQGKWNPTAPALNREEAMRRRIKIALQEWTPDDWVPTIIAAANNPQMSIEELAWMLDISPIDVLDRLSVFEDWVDAKWADLERNETDPMSRPDLRLRHFKNKASSKTIYDE